ISMQELEALRLRVKTFVEQYAIPMEAPETAHDVARLDQVIGELSHHAKAAGIYAPQLPREWGGLGLNWSQCAVIFEEAGRSFLAPGAMNCAAPDQPNMLTLLHAGSTQQQERYLAPLTRGDKRACFAMTEPAPGAGSDPGMLATHAARHPG